MADTPRRPFLNRPACRNYVVGYLLVGTGVVLGGPPGLLPAWLALFMILAGAATLICAIGWSMTCTFRRGRAC